MDQAATGVPSKTVRQRVRLVPRRFAAASLVMGHILTGTAIAWGVNNNRLGSANWEKLGKHTNRIKIADVDSPKLRARGVAMKLQEHLPRSGETTICPKTRGSNGCSVLSD